MDFSKYHFVYNAAAHFDAVEQYPDGIMNVLTGGGRAAFEALCWALAKCAEQGELLRRDIGHDRHEMPSEEFFRLYMKPKHVNEARKIVLDAILKGLRSPDDDTEIDEVLAEIEKKTDAD